jgi:hypothetical protein
VKEAPEAARGGGGNPNLQRACGSWPGPRRCTRPRMSPLTQAARPWETKPASWRPDLLAAGSLRRRRRRCRLQAGTLALLSRGLPQRRRRRRRMCVLSSVQFAREACALLLSCRRSSPRCPMAGPPCCHSACPPSPLRERFHGTLELGQEGRRAGRMKKNRPYSMLV